MCVAAVVNLCGRYHLVSVAGFLLANKYHETRLVARDQKSKFMQGGHFRHRQIAECESAIADVLQWRLCHVTTLDITKLLLLHLQQSFPNVKANGKLQKCKQQQHSRQYAKECGSQRRDLSKNEELDQGEADDRFCRVARVATVLLDLQLSRLDLLRFSRVASALGAVATGCALCGVPLPRLFLRQVTPLLRPQELAAQAEVGRIFRRRFKAAFPDVVSPPIDVGLVYNFAIDRPKPIAVDKTMSPGTTEVLECGPLSGSAPPPRTSDTSGGLETGANEVHLATSLTGTGSPQSVTLPVADRR